MTPNKEHFTIGIVEPYPIIAQGLKLMIEGIKDFDVATMVTDNCQYFMERLLSSHPDILIINPDVLNFKKRDDVEELITETGCSYVVALVTQHCNADILKRYHAVIDISDTREKIESKLRKIVQTERVEVETNELTSREKEILVSVAKGMMNKEIADKYNLSIHTVITHRKNITKKTGIKSVSGLTVFAILNNLIDIQDIE